MRQALRGAADAEAEEHFYFAAFAAHEAVRMGAAEQVVERLTQWASDAEAPLLELYAEHAQCRVNQDSEGLTAVAHRFWGMCAPALAAEAFLADLDKGAVWFEGRKSFRPLFRFPFLDDGRDDKVKRDAVRKGLAKRGLTNAYVTVDASDWFYEGALQTAAREGKTIDHEALYALFIESHVEAAEFYADLAQRTLSRQPAHVMLMHENDLTTVTLVDLIKALRAKGWEVISIDEAYADPECEFSVVWSYIFGYKHVIA